MGERLNIRIPATGSTIGVEDKFRGHKSRGDEKVLVLFDEDSFECLILGFEVWRSQVFGWKKTRKYSKILIYDEFKFSEKL